MELRKITLLTLLSLLMLPGLNQANVDTVEMVDHFFLPEDITITEGDTVVWVNMGTAAHTSTSGSGCTPDGIWDSGDILAGEEFMYVFDSAGVYPYYCIPHCAAGMTGEVTVTFDVGLEHMAEVSVELFPNPVTDQLKVALGNNPAGKLSIEIFDLRGMKLAPLEVQEESEQELVINTSHLRKGLYVFKMKREDEIVLVEKFHKQ